MIEYLTYIFYIHSKNFEKFEQLDMVQILNMVKEFNSTAIYVKDLLHCCKSMLKIFSFFCGIFVCKGYNRLQNSFQILDRYLRK